MSNETRTTPRDLKELMNNLKHVDKEHPAPRDYFQRPKIADRSDAPGGSDWSGSAWSGERWSGRNASGGRDR